MPPYDATVVARLARGGRGAPRQDQHGRVRDGLVDRELGFVTTRNPWDLDARARRLVGRLGGRGRRRAWPRRRSAPTPAARSASPPRSAASSASSRPTAACPATALIAFASSLDQVGPFARDVDGRRAAAQVIAGHDPLRLDLGRRAGARLPRPTLGRGRRGPAHRRPREYFVDGTRSRGRVARCARRSTCSSELGARDRARVAAAHRVRRRRLLPRRAGRGVVEPGALRRRQLRPARARRQGPDRHVRARRARRASAPRSSAASCSAPTRCRPGYYDAYYRKAQKVRTLVRRDFEQAFARVDVIAAPTTPDVAFKLGEKADPLAMYLNDSSRSRPTWPGCPASRCRAASATAGLPIGLQLIGRALRRGDAAARGARLRAGDRPGTTRRPSLGQSERDRP